MVVQYRPGTVLLVSSLISLVQHSPSSPFFTPQKGHQCTSGCWLLWMHSSLCANSFSVVVWSTWHIVQTVVGWVLMCTYKSSEEPHIWPHLEHFSFWYSGHTLTCSLSNCWVQNISLHNGQGILLALCCVSNSLSATSKPQSLHTYNFGYNFVWTASLCFCSSCRFENLAPHSHWSCFGLWLRLCSIMAGCEVVVKLQFGTWHFIVSLSTK